MVDVRHVQGRGGGGSKGISSRRVGGGVTHRFIQTF